MCLLENFKGLVWLTFYFHWTALQSDLKKVPTLTILYLSLGKMWKWSLTFRLELGDGSQWKEGGSRTDQRESPRDSPAPQGVLECCAGGSPSVSIPQDGPRWQDLWA